MKSVLVIDDHPIVLQGCRRILEDAGAQAVLAAGDLGSGYRLYQLHKPEIVIVDLAMQDGRLEGLRLVRKIRSRDLETAILVFSMHSDPAIVAQALDAGASGYLLKDTSSEELLRAVETLGTGRPYLSHDLAVQVALARKRQGVPADFTPRESEILHLLSEGKPYSRIASELGLSYKTVVNVCYQLRQKLEVQSLPELVRRAAELTSGAT